MKRLTIGILAHVDAGKTTLSEALLYETGAIRSMGRVDHGDAHLDTDAHGESAWNHHFFKNGTLCVWRCGGCTFRHTGTCGFYSGRWSVPCRYWTMPFS